MGRRSGRRDDGKHETAAMERQPTAWNMGRRTFPKRDELLLRDVLALPKLSRMGLDCSTFWITASWPLLSTPSYRSAARLRWCSAEMEARWFIRILTVSVLPAPDSPLTSTDWFCFCMCISMKARALVA